MCFFVPGVLITPPCVMLCGDESRAGILPTSTAQEQGDSGQNLVEKRGKNDLPKKRAILAAKTASELRRYPKKVAERETSSNRERLYQYRKKSRREK